MIYNTQMFYRAHLKLGVILKTTSTSMENRLLGSELPTTPFSPICRDPVKLLHLLLHVLWLQFSPFFPLSAPQQSATICFREGSYSMSGSRAFAWDTCWASLLAHQPWQLPLLGTLPLHQHGTRPISPEVLCFLSLHIIHPPPTAHRWSKSSTLKHFHLKPPSPCPS